MLNPVLSNLSEHTFSMWDDCAPRPHNATWMAAGRPARPLVLCQTRVVVFPLARGMNKLSCTTHGSQLRVVPRSLQKVCRSRASWCAWSARAGVSSGAQRAHLDLVSSGAQRAHLDLGEGCEYPTWGVCRVLLPEIVEGGGMFQPRPVVSRTLVGRHCASSRS